MFITKKHLARRTFLRGLGVTLALPFLDSMVPAQTPLAQTAANPVRRFGFIYTAHGMVMRNYTPVKEGSGFETTRILMPVDRFKDQMVVVTGLANELGVLAGAGHPGAASGWLTSARPKKTEGEDVFVGPSIDQIAAAQIGQDTIFPSLEIATEDSTGLVGACDVGFSCTYVNTISWRNAKTPNPMETNPRVLFDRMVGEGSTRMDREQHLKEDRSILDSITGEVSQLRNQLDPNDRSTLNDYLDDVREIERRLQLTEKRNSAGEDLPDAPAGAPDNFQELVRLMLDLQVLAYRTDLTRVTTFVMTRELNNRPFLNLGISDPHHLLSHHQNDPVKLEKLTKIQTWEMEQFAYFLDKLRSSKDGQGNLLDHSLLLYGSGMSDSNQHMKENLPLMLAGGAAGRLQGNRHLKYPDLTPMGNLLRTVAAKVDVKVDQIGDSNGMLSDV